ncbi:hypothetical protein FNV43_RR17873 [Rhamnella rubrinervis]|uniref:Uncharacterized protein n=1 Tax=Rhamnella rubrinervis TaxID=2594499 RepID=A0A8K0DYC7_9ROSA|nr:hypothetical protein FNV43_RR17873 [Rhamnella rubrinervis]
MAEHLPSPPPLPPKESVTKRYKLIWRVLLISNLALGAYMFARARRKDMDIANSKAPKTRAKDSKATLEVPSPPITTNPEFEIPAVPPPVTKPLKVQQPIPEDDQRELFKWMLEEKRKVISKDPEEKKQIDEDKAILKQLIRAKSITRL